MVLNKNAYFLSACLLLLCPDISIAQVELDGTTETEIVRNSPGNRSRIQIEGGSRRGNNVFHSFERFDIVRDGRATFSADSSTDLIINRVTGGGRSSILGDLEVTGNADLIIINPSGILFGSQSELTLNGSFLGTTASELLFDDGFSFSAVVPKLVSNSLAVSLPIRLGFSFAPSPISVRGNSQDILIGFPQGNSFSLIGGDLRIDDVKISAPGSNVNLIGVDRGSILDVQYSQGSLSFEVDSSEELHNINLNGVSIDTSNLEFATSPGDVNILGRNIRLEGVTISTRSIGSTNAGDSSGDIVISASRDLQITSKQIDNQEFFSSLSSSGFLGDSGDIVIRSGRDLNISSSRIITNVLGTGSGGDIDIDATNNVRIVSGRVDVASLGEGRAGQLRLSAKNLFLENGATLSGNSLDAGDSGGIHLSVSDSIVLSGIGDPDGEGIKPSEILTESIGGTDLAGSSNAGNIDIRASNLRLLDGARISASSSSEGNAGSISISTNQDLTLNNASSIESSTTSGEGNLTFSVRDLILLGGSRISTDALFDSDGGNIKIDVDNLVALDNSDITSNAQQGLGGAIEINAEAVFGTEIRDEITSESDITAFSELDPQLNGTIVINTPDLEPGENFEDLPEDVVDPETLVSASPCPEGLESEFVVEGSGGIPSSPGNTLSPEGLIPTDLAEPVDMPDRDSESSLPSESLDSESIAQAVGVTPAWGWVWNEKGEVLLTAHDPAEIASQRLPVHSGLCSGH